MGLALGSECGWHGHGCCGPVPTAGLATSTTGRQPTMAPSLVPGVWAATPDVCTAAGPCPGAVSAEQTRRVLWDGQGLAGLAQPSSLALGWCLHCWWPRREAVS